MNSSKVVVFDLGKVLVDFDYSIAARKVAARSTKSLLDLASLLSSSSLIIQYECGRVTRQQFFDKIRAAVGYEPRVPLEEGLRRFVAWFRAYYKPTV